MLKKTAQYRNTTDHHPHSHGLNTSTDLCSPDRLAVREGSGESAQPYPRFVRETQKKVWARGRHAPANFAQIFLLFSSQAMDQGRFPNAPRMLLIEGYPGTGKSETLRSVAEAAGFQIVEVQAAMLESPTAGKPVEYLARKLAEAGEIVAKGGRALVLIEDIEMALRENTLSSSGTINGDLVRHMLQRYCDDPTSLVGLQSTPVPIVATSNDTSCLRESLIRSGRAERYMFDPRDKDLTLMAWALLRGYMSDQQFIKLRKSTDTWRIAAYRELASRLEQVRTLSQVYDTTLDQLFTIKVDSMSQATPEIVSEHTLSACIDNVNTGMNNRTYLNQ